MDDERWQRIDGLFDAALETAPERRGELLDRECGNDPALRRAVERLLAVESEAEGFLSTPLASDELAGTRIGHYRLIRPLGHGGMGSVYLASREDDYRQEVAIKLVRRSCLDSAARRRLHAERQVLARLEHPNIARLYDGGTTDDGLPYLVMERVAGLPIDRFCDRRRLSVRRRLDLVLQVLAAVAHAHHRLSVHCDIKPSNILVTDDGTPKLLDFGIAKLLGPEARTRLAVTVTGLRPMTLGYASPEQILGRPITAATDIYSVGVLLSELLCGRLPYTVSGDSEVEIGRSILERDPVPPGRRVAAAAAELRGVGPRELESQLRGDLDAIVMKAIRKEPSHRYASAEAFAEDVTRHLEARPVTARRGTWRYRSGRFLRRLVLPPDPRRRRERWAWTAVLLAAGVSLAALALRRPPPPCQDSAARLGGVWDTARRATVEQSFLATGLPFAEDTWNRVAASLDGHAAAWIATDAEICEATLVRGERSARLLDLGRLCLESRREELRALVDLFAAADNTLVIEAAAAVSQLGGHSECTDQAELATRRLPPADPAHRRRLERVRAVAEAQGLQLRLKHPVDFAALRRAEAEVRQLGDPSLLSRILFVLGLAESYEGGDPEIGVRHLEEALEAAIAGGDRPQQTRIYAALLKTLARQQGDLARARFWAGFATASLGALSSGYHDLEVAVFDALGALEWEEGDLDAARGYYGRALASAERNGDPIQQLAAHNRLGALDDASHLHRAIDIIERELGPDHVRLASPLMNLAFLRATEGEYAEALALARRSRELLASTYGDEHTDLVYPLTLIGQVLTAQDRPDEALEPLGQALERAQAGFGSNAQVARDAHVSLAAALLGLGRLEPALEHLTAAAATLGVGVAPGNPSRVNFLKVLRRAGRLSGDHEADVADEELLAWLESRRSDRSSG